MNSASIIELWKSVGWNTLNDYHNHLSSGGEKIVLDELHPDVVVSREFWRAADQHFSTDPVCNHNNFNDRRLTVSESNRLNYNIPLNMGMIAQVEMAVNQLRASTGEVTIAEIGCGYGSFYDNYIEPYPFDGLTYQGFDVVARAEHVVEIQGDDGIFSDQQVEQYRDKFNLFFSSNTFQHLSKRQTSKYMSRVYDMLQVGGYFNVMFVVGNDKSYHYGQVVELYNIQQLETLISSIGFDIIGHTSMKLTNSLTPYSMLLKK